MCGKGACKHVHLGRDPQPGQQSTLPLPLPQTPLDPKPLPKQFVSMEEGLCCLRGLSKSANLHCSKERLFVKPLLYRECRLLPKSQGTGEELLPTLGAPVAVTWVQ